MSCLSSRTTIEKKLPDSAHHDQTLCTALNQQTGKTAIARVPTCNATNPFLTWARRAECRRSSRRAVRTPCTPLGRRARRGRPPKASSTLAPAGGSAGPRTNHAHATKHNNQTAVVQDRRAKQEQRYHKRHTPAPVYFANQFTRHQSRRVLLCVKGTTKVSLPGSSFCKTSIAKPAPPRAVAPASPHGVHTNTRCNKRQQKRFESQCRG